MKKSMNKSTLLAAVAVAGFASAPVLHAAVNPFSNTELASGFNLAQLNELKADAEGKSGEGSKACEEGKCGEGKCGEKCGSQDSSAKQCKDNHCYGKDGEHKHDGIKGDEKKLPAEGKCGEGKCGEGMAH